MCSSIPMLKRREQNQITVPIASSTCYHNIVTMFYCTAYVTTNSPQVPIHNSYAQTMDWDNPWIALLKVWIRALCGQSMDCPTFARSMDCATTHTHVSSVRAVEVVMFDRKASFEDCITKSFVQKKKGAR